MTVRVDIKTYKPVLITGAAGFIGFHLAKRLLDDGYAVVGVDVLSDYYDVGLKNARLAILQGYDGFAFQRMDIADRRATEELFGKGRENEESPFDYVVHLAAQVGVRHSVIDPYAYINSNVLGFLNILEGCRHSPVKHLVFASSSSVYGANTEMPFSVHSNVDHPLSLYAATKKADELMAHSYASLYDIHCTGLRFFTVYGPWGRPDMAYTLFARAIVQGMPIDVFNNGRMKRDFTYIDDVVEGIAKAIGKPAEPSPEWDGKAPDPALSYAPYRLYNIGSNRPVELIRFIEIIEECLGRKAEKRFLPMQKGDVPETYADVEDLARDVGFEEATPIEEGLKRFVEWYLDYYR